ncbi:cytochrome b561 [Phyllobacterium myrsinacearum]|uniref:cytochrome b n=1 Tax=Phyllobacterium myrsinacearum TaxID=28101 RepID=UPI001029A6B2|nr:cytochrome b [Phyllobacterium myrsinacearum]RZS83996.1 cytochrome b561 [Phyllobacterium myrsinacearum]
MLRNDAESYGVVTILFHWIIAVIFLGEILLGYLMVRTGNYALQFSLFQWHKSFGFLILLLSGLRLLWRMVNPRPHPSDGISRIERAAAHAAHGFLYLALFVIPLTGWAVASSSPLQIPTYAFNLVVIPPLPLAISDQAEAFWTMSHAWLAYLSAIVATAHILAALHHHFWKKDAVLLRMLGARRPAPVRPHADPLRIANKDTRS